MKQHTYLCIDLKSFYASVECVERGLDPMTARLVVADPERSTGTICLAVSPELKRLGVRNRCRVYEIPKNIDYIMAVPRMQLYIDYAAEIYGIYLEHIAPEDMHVYSIDEVFLDVTRYLPLYGFTPRQMAAFLMDEVRSRLGIRATCGIGTNLYLAKIALDIHAKHAPDFIAELDERTYCETLWTHRPLTDFWRVGPGTERRLERLGLYTMRDIAHANEDALYKAFGIDAELLIDHAWGRETATMEDIHNYHTRSTSLSSGQVLMRDYAFDEGKVILREMMEQLALDMMAQGVATRSVTLWIGYSGRTEHKGASGTAALETETNNARALVRAVLEVYDRVVSPQLPIRRVNISCNQLVSETELFQYSLLDGDTRESLARDRRLQETVLELKHKFGKNAVLKGVDLTDCATAIERNGQIGGHKSG